MTAKKLNRRDFLRMSALTTAGAALAACAPEVVERTVKVPVKETVQVEVPVEQTVVVEGETVVVTAEPPPRQEVTIVFMYNSGEIAIEGGGTEEALALFEEKYAPYKVERLDASTSTMYAMLAAGNQLDVVRGVGVLMPPLVLRRVPLDITDYFATSEVLKLDDLLPVNDMFTAHGRRYGAIKDWSPDFGMWVNKALWKEAGVEPPEPGEKLSYQRLRELSSQLSKFEGDVRQVTGTDLKGASSMLQWVGYTFANSRGLFEDDIYHLNIADDEELVEMLAWAVDWEKEKGIPTAINARVTGDAQDEFLAGASAVAEFGYWFGGRVGTAELIDPAECILMPAPTWGPNYFNGCGYGAGGFLSSTTQIPDAAWKLFEWFFGEEPAVARAKGGWGLPALASLLPLMPQDEPWRKNAYEVCMADIENSIAPQVASTPYCTPWIVGDAWGALTQPLLEGDITLDELIAAVEEDVNEQIADNMDAAGVKMPE